MCGVFWMELDEFEKKALDFIAKKAMVDPTLITIHGAEFERGGAIVIGTFTKTELVGVASHDAPKYTRHFRVSFDETGRPLNWKISDRQSRIESQIPPRVTSGENPLPKLPEPPTPPWGVGSLADSSVNA